MLLQSIPEKVFVCEELRAHFLTECPKGVTLLTVVTVIRVVPAQAIVIVDKQLCQSIQKMCQEWSVIT
jgi:hypothetical protein